MAGKGWPEFRGPNPKGQINLGPTDPPRLGSDLGQVVYVMHCPACDRNYGANGSNIWNRTCPFHKKGSRQGKGKPGEPLQGNELDWRP